MDRLNDYEKHFDAFEREIYGLSTIKACPVNHCHGALAVVLTFPNGFKAAYSGDCLPSSDFARIGKGATLLIHEATFDDELAGDALAKKHSTTSDALRIGKEMGARRILLTHFSQRYQKIPVMDSKSDQVAIVAFDYMRCLLGDFAKLAHFRPALLKLYEEKEEDKKD
jgi:ribonuclease Z